MTTTPTAPPHRRRHVPGWRRLPRWARWVLLALILIVLGLSAFAAWLSWVLAGGWDGLRPKAQPDDRAVVAAREVAGAPLGEVTAAVLAAMDRPAEADLVESARVRADECREGQNNWKVHSGFTLRCELEDVVALRLHPATGGSPGADPASDRGDLVQTVAAQLHDDLERDGWTEPFTSSGLHVRGSVSTLGLKGYYTRSTSSLRGAAGDHTGSALALEIDLYLDSPPDYELPRPAGTGLGQTRRVEGDLRQFQQSMVGGRAPRLLVQVSLPYFED